MRFTPVPAQQRVSVRPLTWSVIGAVFALSLDANLARAQVHDPNVWITNGNVNAIATAGDTIYLGGNFTYVGPNTGSFVGIDAETGTLQLGWPRVNGIVYCSAPDGASGWYIGGSFTSVGGVARAGLAHIRADMTLDAWNPGSNSSVVALGCV